MSQPDINKSPHPDARARLKASFQDLSHDDHPKGWNSLWEQDFLPWDKGFPSPALVDLLTDRRDLLGPAYHVDPGQGRRRKRALVPGCGKGYDVLLLAAFGYDAYGLEFSPVALKRAGMVQETMGDQEVYRVREEKEGRGGVVWLTGDFFKDESLQEVEGDKNFDLIYDYTFLSALHPDMRPAWSRRMNELLAPAGRLVCLEFPTYKPPNTGGPPWALPPRVYAAHLPRPGQKLPYDDEAGLLESDIGPEAEDGLIRIAHFQPERTHEIGKDDSGKVTDWLSVWSHEPLA